MRCWGEMLYQRQFRTRMQLSKVYLIQEGSDEEDAASGAAEEIFGGEGVGNLFWIEAFAFVGDGDDEGFAVVLEAGADLLGGIVAVAVEDGVDGCFADGHGYAKAFVLVEAGGLCELLGGGLDLGHAIHCRWQLEAAPPFLWSGQEIRLDFCLRGLLRKGSSRLPVGCKLLSGSFKGGARCVKANGYLVSGRGCRAAWV